MDKEQIQVKPQTNKELPTSANDFDLSNYILKTKSHEKNSSNIFSWCHTEPFFNLVVIALGTVTLLLRRTFKTILGLCCNTDKASPQPFWLQKGHGVLSMASLWTSDLKSFKDTQQTSRVFPALPGTSPEVLWAEKSSPTGLAGRCKEVRWKPKDNTLPSQQDIMKDFYRA